MIHAISDGKIFRCMDWKDLVRKLRRYTFDDTHTKHEYMTDVQHRIQALYEDIKITKSPKKFCLLLDKMGLITILVCKMCKHSNERGRFCEEKHPYKPMNPFCIYFENGDIRRK